MTAPYQSAPGRFLAGLVRVSAHYAWVVVTLWLVILLIASQLASSLPHVLKGGIGAAPGSGSDRVEKALARDFDSPFTNSLVVMVGDRARLLPSSRSAPVAGAEIVKARLAVAQALSGSPEVSRVREVMLPHKGADPEPVLLLGLRARTQEGAEASVLPVRRKVRETLSAWPGCTAIVTGDAAFGVDLVQLAGTESGAGESRVLPFTLLALVSFFGAPVAALFPLVSGVAAVSLAMGGLALLGSFFPLSVYASNVAAMLGLGLGIDYALLGISRVREEGSLDPVEALGRAAPAIAFSGLTVLLAMSCLALVPVQDLVGMGTGGAVVAGTSVLAGLTLLPALVRLLGRWRDAPVFISRHLVGRAQVLRWRHRAERIVRRPCLSLVLALLVLVPMAVAMRGMSVGFPEPEQLPPAMESTRGLLLLNKPSPVRGLSPIHLLISSPDSLLQQGRLMALARLTNDLEADPRVSEVWSLGGENVTPLALGSAVLGPERMRSLLSEEARWLLSKDGHQTVIEIFLRGDVGTAAQQAYVSDLRQAVSEGLPGLEDSSLQLGGLAALSLDLENQVLRAWPWIVLGTCLVTLVLLGAFTRSWLLPLKAVFANLLVVAAALGGTTVLIAHPVLSKVLGLPGPVAHMPPGVPLIVFCLVFGLSMDYEVFLLSRVVEAHRRGLSDVEAVVEGLGVSAGVITGGAVIMAIVFFGFATAPLLVVKILGLALGLGILLDATVVRLFLIPSLIVLVGRYNWVPGDRAVA